MPVGETSAARIAHLRRSLADVTVELRIHGDPRWSSLDRALVVLSQLEQERTDVAAVPVTATEASFGAYLTPGRVTGPAEDQPETVILTTTTRAQIREVHEALAWPPDRYAELSAALTRQPAAAATTWERFGVSGGPPVHDAIRRGWSARLQCAETKRLFDACLARHHLRLLDGGHVG